MKDDEMERARARKVLEDVISCGLDDNVQISANHAVDAMVAFAQQPKGWRLVPVVPTEAMMAIGGRIVAGLSSGRAIEPYERDAADAYSAMLDVAPTGEE